MRRQKKETYLFSLFDYSRSGWYVSFYRTLESKSSKFSKTKTQYTDSPLSYDKKMVVESEYKTRYTNPMESENLSTKLTGGFVARIFDQRYL